MAFHGWDAIARTRNTFLTTAAALIVITFRADAAEIKTIDFRVDQNGNTVLEIIGSEKLKYSLQENQADRQLVINLPGSTLSPFASRMIDTSEFESAVKLISPYETKNSKTAPQSRIAIQMDPFQISEVVESGPKLTLTFKGNGVARGAPDGSSPNFGNSNLASKKQGPLDDLYGPGKGAEIEEAMRTDGKKFTGTPISIQVKDADVSEVLRLIGNTSGFNILIHPAVTGKVTLSLEDVPWDQVLDTVLSTARLGAERRGNILRVLPLAELLTEKRSEAEARLQSLQNTPKVSQIFQLSYADGAGLRTLLLNLAQATAPAGTLGNAQAVQTNIQYEERTSSLIVTDYPENLPRISRLIEILDEPTPQVLVEAKVVEVTDRYDFSVSGGLGIGGSAALPGQNLAFTVNNAVITDLGATEILSRQAGQGIFGFFPSIDGIIPGAQRLNAILSIGEAENKVKITSSPRALVSHNRTATITQEFPYVNLVETATVTGNVRTPQFGSSQINLNVTPRVANDGSVYVRLNLQRSVPVAFADATVAANRSVNTEVMVDSGSTIVIGGIYAGEEQSSSRGLPFFRKLPIIGKLFGAESEIKSSSELMFFVTPRIVNPRRKESPTRQIDLPVSPTVKAGGLSGT